MGGGVALLRRTECVSEVHLDLLAGEGFEPVGRSTLAVGVDLRGR
jgi:hypothetical protein